MGINLQKLSVMNYTFNRYNKSSCLILIHLLVFAIMTGLLSCGRADMNLPVGGGSGTPQTVTITSIENISGGAIVNYKVPGDNSINYVEAVYEIGGKEVRRKGSFYTSSLLLDGFPEARDYKVSIYSVSYGEARSEPVVVNVSPSTPPYKAVAEQLDIKPIFGGIKTEFKNPTKSNLQITFLQKDASGRWTEVETLYTSLDSGAFYVRNLENREYTFGVVCKDRWQNVSDTITSKAVPLYEGLVDRTKMVSYPLPTDLSYEFPKIGLKMYHTGAPGAGDIPCLWDGETHAPFALPNPYYFFQNITTGYSFSGLPSSITIDLGQPYILSRFVYWPRPTSKTSINYTYLFSTTHVKTFELWGSNNPSPDGSYETWTKIGAYESIRPSGNTSPGVDYNTEEDRKIASTGESYDMPEDIVPYRYIRYKVFSTWGAQPYWASSELQFYGKPEN